MALGAVRHSRKKIKKAHYKARRFNVEVNVYREPVYARGTIYGVKVKKAPAFRVVACVKGAGLHGPGAKRHRCAEVLAQGPTAAVRKALAKLSKTVR